MGCFSMYASKVLTSGEGGAITTDSDEFAEKLQNDSKSWNGEWV